MPFKFHNFSCLCTWAEILASLPQIPALYVRTLLRICWQEPSVRHYVTCGQRYPFKNYKPFYIFQHGSYNNKTMKISWQAEIILYDRLTQISSFLNFPTHLDLSKNQVMAIYDQTQCPALSAVNWNHFCKNIHLTINLIGYLTITTRQVSILTYK